MSAVLPAVCGLLCALAVLRPGADPLARWRRLHRRPPRRGASDGAGAGLLALVRRPARRGRPEAVVPVDLAVELVAAATRAGCAVPTACRAVSLAVAAVARTPADAALAEALARLAGGRRSDHPDLEPVRAVLDRAARSGLAPAGLLRHAAGARRRDERSRAAEAVGRLPARLVLPAGLCLLPAAMLLGVAPVVLDLLAGVLAPGAGP